MAFDKIGPHFGVRGYVSIWRVNEETGIKTFLAGQPNQIQYSWGYMAAKQLGYSPQPDRYNYNISAMYIEYENQVSPSDISIPAFSRDIDIGYYNSLDDSATRDFLRVPLRMEPTLSVSSGYEANLPINQQGNQLTFFVQTAGGQGVHGKAFGTTSKVYAASLIAAPVFSDRTKDVIFARTIFSTENQVTKEPSSQIGITWDIAFE